MADNISWRDKGSYCFLKMEMCHISWDEGNMCMFARRNKLLQRLKHYGFMGLKIWIMMSSSLWRRESKSPVSKSNEYIFSFCYQLAHRCSCGVQPTLALTRLSDEYKRCVNKLGWVYDWRATKNTDSDARRTCKSSCGVG